MPVIRTTIHPDTPMEVTDAEARTLQRQGLLVESPTPDPVPAKIARRTADQNAEVA